MICRICKHSKKDHEYRPAMGKEHEDICWPCLIINAKDNSDNRYHKFQSNLDYLEAKYNEQR